MKIKIILLALLFSTCRHSQAQWTKLTSMSYPDVELTDVYASGSRIIATGFSFPAFQGLIFRSNNDGATWDTIQVPPPGFLFKTIAFKDPDTGFIGGYGNSSIWLRSTDGGQKWEYYLQDLVNKGINDMHFINSKTGFASGYAYNQFSTGQCYHTTDGGHTWWSIDSVNLGCLDTLPMDYVQFLDAKTGYGRADFLGQKSIMKTLDSGNSWQLQYTHTTSMAGMHFWNVNNGILVDVNGDVYKTTNGGQNWVKGNGKVPGTGNVLLSMAFLNQTTGFIVADAGRIFKTTDGGETWTKETNVTNATLLRVRFYDNRGYAVASTGEILRSAILPNNVNEVLSLHDQLNVYPNPATDILNVSSYQQTYKNLEAELIDIKGMVVQRGSTSDAFLQLNTKELPAGIYTLRVHVQYRTASYKINISH